MSRKNTVLLYLVRTPPARGKLFFVCRVTSKEILTLVKTCRGPRSFAASASDLKIVDLIIFKHFDEAGLTLIQTLNHYKAVNQMSP